MNVSQTGGFRDPSSNGTWTSGSEAPMNDPNGPAKGQAMSYNDATNQHPINMFFSDIQPDTTALNPGQPLQNQNLSGGLMGTIEDMLQQFLEKLKNLINMASGKNDGPQLNSPDLSPTIPTAADMMSSAPALNAGANGGSGVQPVSAPQVRLAGGASATGDASLNTNDPDLQKLVDKFGPEYQQASKETGVPARLLVAQTMQESGGDVNAKSTNPGNGKTDSGMNQINPDTYESMRKQYPDKLSGDSNSPQNQIMCAALMLKDGKDKFGSYDAALRAYNSGDDQVDKNNLSHVTIGDPNYVNEVNAYAAKFH